MALVTRTIPSLMNGISQQPPLLRSPDQTEDEVNTWNHIAEGVSRRPPTQTILALTGLTAGVDYSIHHINRDVSERYLVLIKQGGIMVFDETTGAAKTVNAPNGWGYLDAVGDVYRAVSIADYTFIVNTTKTVTMLGVGADQVADPTTYRLPGGTTPTRTTATVSAGGSFAGMLAQYQPNLAYAGGLTGTVPSMDKLPDPPCSGCVYRVLGQNDTSFVSFYVSGDGTVWNETVAPGLVNAIDATTMPWALIREADGTFTFAPFSWQPRRVGDEQTNPYPTFIGRTIRDAFFYQNRLGFVVDDGVIFSGAGDYGDFFRRTVLDYIDADTLAASAAVTDVAILDFALPFADGVMLFSRQHQFSLTNGDSGLSAHSIAITPVTKYVMAEGVRPTPMGSQAHFLSEARGFVSVQEYTRLAGSDPTEAADITAHVPHLIPKGASEIIPFPDLNALLVLTHDAAAASQSKAYVYQFFWDGDKKFLSAWRVWDFGDGIPVTGSYESGALHLVMQRPDGFFLEKIDLAPQALTPNQDHVIYLDRQASLTGTYDALANTTTFLAPFLPDPAKLQLVTGNAFAPAEAVLAGAMVSGSTITVPGDYSGHPVTVGHTYTTRLVVSKQYPMDWQSRPLTTGRLVMHTFTANVTNTGYLRAEVYPYGKEVTALQPDLMVPIEFRPDILGSAQTLLGKRAYLSDAFTFSVAGSSDLARIELVNDSPFDSTITSGQWVGLYFSTALA